jgi:hypothetical protein
VERIISVSFKKQKMVANSTNRYFNNFWYFIGFFSNFSSFSLRLYAFLMNKKKRIKLFLKVFFLFLTSLFVCFLTYRLCYFIAEKYFFDKFFYQKSIKYGYWIKTKKLKYEDFGKRGKDVANLEKNKPIKTDDKKYNIAIFGDSLVWGQGMANDNRFAVLLEKKLNKIRPTKIYSFASSGDNIFDYYVKYKKTLDVYGEMNLNIFSLFNNDFLFDEYHSYETNQFVSKLSINCTGKIFYNPFSQPNNIISNDELARRESFDKNSVNFCAYKKLLPLLPTNNTIYFNIDSIRENWDIQNTFSQIITADLKSLSPSFDKVCNPTNQFNPCKVSKNETHPSSFINKEYSNILFDEITSNSKWGFKND